MCSPTSRFRALRARALPAWLATLVALGTGCREGVPPFETPVLDRDANAFAVTLGSGQDADPRWLPAGDTLLYHTTQFGALPAAPGAIIRIGTAGGAGEPIFPEVQTLAGKLLATPAYSPDGDRIAYMDLISVDAPGACARVVGQVVLQCAPSQPLLDRAVLRVRRVGETRVYLIDPSVSVQFAGTDPNRRFASEWPWFETLYPFQAAHRDEYAMLFRPSWSPDGQRIAFSDGLSIRLWRVGDEAATSVPGTDDGVSVAWSPDGEWLAFTVLERVAAETFACICNPDPLIVVNRTIFGAGARTVVLIRPDGSDRTELGSGEDPAWSPDGQYLFIRRDDQIVRIPRAGGAAVAIANTTRGRSPAVSPDGSWLAFARRKVQETVDYDIWVVSLSQ